MDWKDELKPFAIITAIFLAFFLIPFELPRLSQSLMEALLLAKDYAREHVLLCLVPAFFIAGAISVFLSKEAVMKYLGPQAKRYVAYPVAAVSGTILAVCSCTILPLFAGIHKRGAGLGPATAFLYSGPAINILAIILTTRILGFEIGIARAVGAIVFSLLIGVIMAAIFKDDDTQQLPKNTNTSTETDARPLSQTVIYFALMVLILVFANWGKPQETTGLWAAIHASKWYVTSGFALLLGIALIKWFRYNLLKMAGVAAAAITLAILFPNYPAISFTAGFLGLAWTATTSNEDGEEWVGASWGFAKQIIPLLFYGVLVAGFLLGRPGHQGLIPPEWITSMVGGNSLFANFFASVVGAFMYFATLTEVPILQGLIAGGMGKGPALALLLAGPALSLPNMLVIRSVMGTKKTIVFVTLVVIMATITGFIYGALF